MPEEPAKCKCHTELELKLVPLENRMEKMESRIDGLGETLSRIHNAIVGDKEMGQDGFAYRMGKMEGEMSRYKVLKAKAAVLISIGTAVVTAFLVKMSGNLFRN